MGYMIRRKIRQKLNPTPAPAYTNMARAIQEFVQGMLALCLVVAVPIIAIVIYELCTR